MHFSLDYKSPVEYAEAVLTMNFAAGTKKNDFTEMRPLAIVWPGRIMCRNLPSGQAAVGPGITGNALISGSRLFQGRPTLVEK